MQRPGFHVAPTQPHARALSCVSAALALLFTACGVETSPNHKDSGVNSGSGAGGKAGDGSGKGGNSGSSSGGKSGAGHSGAGDQGGSEAGASGAGGETAGTDASGTGGNAGDAGNTPTGCTSDTDCPADHPQCNANHECSPCTSDAACEGRDGLPRCSFAGMDRGQCVQCLGDENCTGAADKPHCVQHVCSECATHADCADPLKPQCTAGTCTGCTGDDACAGRSSGTHCVTDTAAADAGQCVACTEHAHCPNELPECGAGHECGACTSNDACAGRSGLTVCDLSSEAVFTGQCVQCTGTNYSGCGTDAPTGMPYVCDSLARSCTNVPLQSRGLCQSCSSDAACASGQLCVRELFQAQDLSYVCLSALTAGGACATARPYVARRDSVQSIDGTMANVCGLSATTCEALNDFRGTSCSTPEMCGLSDAADGMCRELEVGINRCTTPCASSDDCPTDYACNISVSPRVCDLQPGHCYVDADCTVGDATDCKSNGMCGKP